MSWAYLSKLVPLVALVELVALMTLVAQVPAEKLPKANASRLVYDQDGVAYLNIKTKRKTAEGYQDNTHRVPFTGVAFWEESWGRAEVTYSNGIPDGEVTVVSRNRLLYQFRYEHGRKVANSVTSGTSSTSGAGADLDSGEGEGSR